MLKLDNGGVENWNSFVITCMKHEEARENEPVDYFLSPCACITIIAKQLPLGVF